MSWKIPDLSDYIVTVGKNGGPVGMSQHSIWYLPCWRGEAHGMLIPFV